MVQTGEAAHLDKVATKVETVEEENMEELSVQIKIPSEVEEVETGEVVHKHLVVAVITKDKVQLLVMTGVIRVTVVLNLIMKAVHLVKIGMITHKTLVMIIKEIKTLEILILMLMMDTNTKSKTLSLTSL